MRSLLIVLGSLLLLGGLWQWLGHGGVLPRIPEAQRAALDLLRTPEPKLPGRNAALAASLVLRGVAPGEWPRYEKLPTTDALATLDAMPASADIRPDEMAACQIWGNGCLQAVRDDPAAARELQQRIATRLERIDAFEHGYQHLAVVGEWNFASALPPLQGMHVPVRLDAALRFMDGDQAGALGRLCRHAGFWRNLRQNTELLIVDMVGVAYVTGAANGFAEMLAQLPADVAVPTECETAFAPLADIELRQCRVMKTEFSGYANTLRDLSTQENVPGFKRQSGLVKFLLYRHEPTMAQLAPPMARFCDAEHDERIAARAELPPMTHERCAIDGWIFNYVGCMYAGIASPGISFGDYYHRLLDLDGRMKLASTAAWLHQQRDRDLAAAFARRPESLRDTRHRLDGGRCTPTLHFAPRHVRKDADPWMLPLAPPSGCAIIDEPAIVDEH